MNFPDFRSGQSISQTVFFAKGVDIHHIFPKAWCEKNDLTPAEYDTVVNKTPLSYRTNRIIGGVAPSDDLASHAIPVVQLRADDFKGLIQARQQRLLVLVAAATGNSISLPAQQPEEEGEELSESLARDAGIVFPDAG